MTMFMTGTTAKAALLTGPKRRRCWAPAENLTIAQGSYAPRVMVSLFAPQHVQSSAYFFSQQLLASEGAFTTTEKEETDVPASGYRDIQHQTYELQRLLCKETQEARILKETLELAGDSANHCYA